MTDKQLAYTLRLLVTSLRAERSSIYDALGSPPIEMRERKNIFGGTAVDFPILDGFDEIIGNLEQSIKHLEAETKSG